ncbi:unnamed protein product, partial [Hymenolepis diminuta]
IRNREERLKLDSINSTIVGRTVKVGVIKYGPFYDNGCGFSVPIMEALKTSAKVNLVVVEYDFNSDDPYYLKMQTALKDG